MIILEYCCLDVVQAGLYQLVKSGADRTCMAELQQLLFPWRDIVFCHAATDTPFNENSRSSQFNITKAFRLD